MAAAGVIPFAKGTLRMDTMISEYESDLLKITGML